MPVEEAVTIATFPDMDFFMSQFDVVDFCDVINLYD
jgi:hypothetical protein